MTLLVEQDNEYSKCIQENLDDVNDDHPDGRISDWTYQCAHKDYGCLHRKCIYLCAPFSFENTKLSTFQLVSRSKPSKMRRFSLLSMLIINQFKPNFNPAQNNYFNQKKPNYHIMCIRNTHFNLKM